MDWPNLATSYDVGLVAFVTCVRGSVDAADVQAWRRDLRAALHAPGVPAPIALLVDTRHYRPDCLETHRLHRSALLDEPLIRDAACLVLLHHDALRMAALAVTADPPVHFVADPEVAVAILRSHVPRQRRAAHPVSA